MLSKKNEIQVSQRNDAKKVKSSATRSGNEHEAISTIEYPQGFQEAAMDELQLQQLNWHRD